LHDIPANKFLFRFAIKKPKIFFVLNKYIKNSLIELGVDESIVHIIPSGVDVDTFSNDISKSEARGKLMLPQDKNIVVYTGHFYKWKGVDALLEVAKVMKEKIFVFVGGVEPEITDFKIKSMGVDNIIVIPYVDRSVVSLYLKASDVLVIPNSKYTKISSDYTSPLKLLEYMISGSPIVASDLPSLREVLNEKNSVFATPDDPQSFIVSINKVLTDGMLSESISKQARIDVLPYDWLNRAKKIQDIIKINLSI
jgi:glycosyltransferase involved in cell wall biosynthesis